MTYYVLFKIKYCPFRKPNTDWSFAKDDGTNLKKLILLLVNA